MERRTANLPTAAGSGRCHDSRRRAQRRRSVAVGAQCRGRISGQSALSSEGLSRTGRRVTGRDEAKPWHVRYCRRPQSAVARRTPEVSRARMAEDCRNDSAARYHTETIAEGRRKPPFVEDWKGGALK